MSTGESWLITIVGGALAGLIVAAVVAIFNKPVREKFWKPTWHALRWPYTLRLTTSTRQRQQAKEKERLERVADLSRRRFQEVCDLLGVQPVREDSTVVRERIERLRDASKEAWAHAQSQIDAIQSLAAQQVADALRASDDRIETARVDGVEHGRTMALAEVEARRAIPLLRPAWRIDEVGTADAFVLKNTQHSVVISNASVDAPTGDFRFAGAAQMRGVLDGNFEFYGQKTEKGRRFGVDFVVKWQDANGEWWTQTVSVEKEPRRMTVL